jgi:hypothetical protein
MTSTSLRCSICSSLAPNRVREVRYQSWSVVRQIFRPYGQMQARPRVQIAWMDDLELRPMLMPFSLNFVPFTSKPRFIPYHQSVDKFAGNAQAPNCIAFGVLRCEPNLIDLQAVQPAERYHLVTLDFQRSIHRNCGSSWELWNGARIIACPAQRAPPEAYATGPIRRAKDVLRCKCLGRSGFLEML